MSQFTVARRTDPYKNFNFRVRMDGRYVAAASKATGLHAKRREGAEASSKRTIPSLSKYPTITLKRGIVGDAEFHAWASASAQDQRSTVRKNIIVEIYDNAGGLLRSFSLFGCWSSKYEATDADANANTVAIEAIRLGYESWEVKGATGTVAQNML